MAVKIFSEDADFEKGSILNIKLNPMSTSDRTDLALALSSGDVGYVATDIDENAIYTWDGSAWKIAGKQDFLSLDDTPNSYAGQALNILRVNSAANAVEFHNLVKADIGLGNVDNTSDADKPISTATQAALDANLSYLNDNFFKQGGNAFGTYLSFGTTDDWGILFKTNGTNWLLLEDDGRLHSTSYSWSIDWAGVANFNELYVDSQITLTDNTASILIDRNGEVFVYGGHVVYGDPANPSTLPTPVEHWGDGSNSSYYGNDGQIKGFIQANGSNFEIHSGSGIPLKLFGNVIASGTLTASIGAGGPNNFVVSNGGLLQYRTPAQVLSDIGAAPSIGGGYVSSVSGTAGRISSTGGTTPVLDLITTGVTASTYGSATAVPVLTIDAYGRITSASLASISSAITFNGDVSGSGTTGSTTTLTLATVNSNVGSFGSATQVGQFTVNAKGLVTAASNVTITPAASSITGAQALTKIDDTNVTLTLGGTPSTALLQAVSLTLGWTGTLADARIASSASWNTAYSRSLTSIGFSGGTLTLTKQDASTLTTSIDGRYLQLAGGTMTGNILMSGGSTVDTVTTAGTDVLNIGTANADTINIGWSGATINIVGALVYQNVTNLSVTDKLIRINVGGGATSGSSSGFEIEEGGVATGYFTSDGTRTGWLFKSPASQVLTLGLDLLTASRTLKAPDQSGTIAVLTDLTGGYTPLTRTLTINGSTQDLSVDRTWTISVTGTSNRISVTGGTGLTPTIDISSSYVGQSSITTVGTLTSGSIGAGFTAIPNSALANSTISGIALGSNLASLSISAELIAGGATTYNGSIAKSIAIQAGSVTNTMLTNSSITIGSTTISLGATSTTLAGLTSVTSTTFVGALTGNASTATALQTARAINGVSFDGTAAITITAAAGTLTGTTLNATVVNSSLTSVGTIATGVWQGTVIGSNYGGAGSVNGILQANGSGVVSAITVGSGLTFSAGTLSANYGSITSLRNYNGFTATAGQTAFTIPSGYIPTLIDVYVNGVKLIPVTDFTATDGTTVTLTSAAALNDKVEMYDYRNAGGNFGVLRTTQTYTATASQTTFTFTAGYTVGMIDVFFNGARLNASEYTATDGSTVVLATGAPVNTVIDIIAYGNVGNGFITGASQINLVTWTSGAGTITSADTVLTALQKLNGNQALYLPLTGGTLSGGLTGTSASFTTGTFSTGITVNKAGSTVLYTGPYVRIANAGLTEGFTWQYGDDSKLHLYNNSGTDLLKVTHGTGAFEVMGPGTFNGALLVTTTYPTTNITFRTQDNSGYGIYVSNQNTLNFNYGVNATSDGYINNTGYSNGVSQFRNLHIVDGKGNDIALFTGSDKSVLFSGPIIVKGVNPGGIGANALVADFSGGYARFFSYGPSGATTNGGYIFNSERSDGSNSLDYLTLAGSNGQATFVSTGAQSINITSTDANSVYTAWKKNTSTIAGYVGTSVGLATGAPVGFGIRSDGDLYLMSGGGGIAQTINTSQQTIFANSVQFTNGGSYITGGLGIRAVSNILYLYGGTSGVAINKSDNSTTQFYMDATGAASFGSSLTAASFKSSTASVAINSGATQTIYTVPVGTGYSGLYTVIVNVNGGSNIYMASAQITADDGDNIQMHSIYDGSNVTLSVSGRTIRITNDSPSNLTWTYSIHFQSLN